MPTPGGSGGDWRVLLLSRLGAPANNLNIDALQWWADSEGMPDWENNWLATTYDGYGGTVVNSAGVKAYPTVADGVAATAATLDYGAYSGVVGALRQGSSLVDIWTEINSSPWCAHCQNGDYPVVLLHNLGAAPPPGGPGGGGPPPPPPTGQAAAESAWDDVREAFAGTANSQIGHMISLSEWVRNARQ